MFSVHLPAGLVDGIAVRCMSHRKFCTQPTLRDSKLSVRHLDGEYVVWIWGSFKVKSPALLLFLFLPSLQVSEWFCVELV